MIADLDRLIRDVLIAEVPGISAPAQIRFQPPDDKWRGYVSSLTVDGSPANALNVYLAEIRENRRLRSSERVRETLPGGTVAHTRTPERIDCHYLITAWSSAAVTPPLEPTLDEHAVLYEALAVLERNTPLNASRAYAPQSPPWLAMPEAIRDVDLPTAVATAEPVPNLHEFWATMGTDHRWKPVVHLVVTLPIEHRRQVAGPMVTTTVTHYPFGDELLNLGGTVLAAGSPVPGAWIRVVADPGGHLVRTGASDGLGRFLFTGLAAGRYRFHAGAQGVGTHDRTIDVPSNTGEYDLHLA